MIIRWVWPFFSLVAADVIVIAIRSEVTTTCHALPEPHNPSFQVYLAHSYVCVIPSFILQVNKLNTMANNTLKTLHPWLQENDTQISSGDSVKSYSHDNGSDAILCVVHGYPQSSYM